MQLEKSDSVTPNYLTMSTMLMSSFQLKVDRQACSPMATFCALGSWDTLFHRQEARVVNSLLDLCAKLSRTCILVTSSTRLPNLSGLDPPKKIPLWPLKLAMKSSLKPETTPNPCLALHFLIREHHWHWRAPLTIPAEKFPEAGQNTRCSAYVSYLWIPWAPLQPGQFPSSPSKQMLLVRLNLVASCDLDSKQ